MRRLARLILTVTTVLTAAASLWALSQNPFAEPFVERSASEAKAALTRALADEADAEYLTAALEAALVAEDLDQVVVYQDLAADNEVVLDAKLVARANAFVAQENGFANRAGECATCAIDIANCKRLAQIAACAVPVEMTPIGDLNALRRAGVDWAYGDEVDRLEVSLALVGLGATGLSVGTAGTSLSVKAGASLMRVARRIDAMTPTFNNTLLGMADIAVDWDEIPDYLLGKVSLDDVTDTAKLAALGDLAGDLDRVRTNTSTAEMLTLMRHVDTAEDAKNLAKVAEIQGPRTRHTLDTLGKARTFRVLHRVSDLALLTIGLLTALGLQLLSLAGLFLRRLVRPTRR